MNNPTHQTSTQPTAPAIINTAPHVHQPQRTLSSKAYITSTDTNGPRRERELISSTHRKQEHLLAHALLMHGILVRLPKIIAATTSSTHRHKGSAPVDKPHYTRNTEQSQKKPQWIRPATLRHPSSRRSNACGAKRNDTPRVIQ